MRKSTAAGIATALVAVLAVAAAVFTLYRITEEEKLKAEMLEKNSRYEPSEELAEEMKDAVEVLISNNYTVVKLFFTREMSHAEEPYGNDPDDGIWTVTDETYTTLESIYSILPETYMPEEAERIKTNPHGYGPIYVEDTDGSLGQVLEYKGNPEYNVSWSNPSFLITPVSDIECNIEIFVHDKEGNPLTKNATMFKANGKWLLLSVIQ